MSLKQPVGQVRLTNVSILRYRRCGHRFELAVYPNKVSDYRKGVETSVDEVLQSPLIFSNVSKGISVNRNDLIEAFGPLHDSEIIAMILDKGSVQVNEKERQAELNRRWRDIASIIVEKTINPITGMPHTQRTIEAAMRQIHFSVHLRHSSKSQSSKVLSMLKHSQVIPIERTKMRIRMAIEEGLGGEVGELIKRLEEEEEKEEENENDKGSDSEAKDVATLPSPPPFPSPSPPPTHSKLSTFEFVISPSHLRHIEEFVQLHSKPSKVIIEIVDLKAFPNQRESKEKILNEQIVNAFPTVQPQDSKAPSKSTSSKVTKGKKKKSKSADSSSSSSDVEAGAIKLMNRFQIDEGDDDVSNSQRTQMAAKAKRERKAKIRAKLNKKVQNDEGNHSDVDEY